MHTHLHLLHKTKGKDAKKPADKGKDAGKDAKADKAKAKPGDKDAPGKPGQKAVEAEEELEEGIQSFKA